MGNVDSTVLHRKGIFAEKSTRRNIYKNFTFIQSVEKVIIILYAWKLASKIQKGKLHMLATDVYEPTKQLPLNDAEYRRLLLAHSKTHGLGRPRRRGNDWTFKNPKSGKRMVVEFEPRTPDTYLRYAKSVLTRISSAPIKNRGRWKPAWRRNPSTNYEDDWLKADNPERDIDPINAALGRTGKWMIFCDTANVDEYWRTIKTAIEIGHVLISAKVSSIASCRKPGQHTICVYTDDFEYREDVFAAREELRRLGFTWELFYKSDEMTGRGESTSLYRG